MNKKGVSSSIGEFLRDFAWIIILIIFIIVVLIISLPYFNETVNKPISPRLVIYESGCEIVSVAVCINMNAESDCDFVNVEECDRYEVGEVIVEAEISRELKIKLLAEYLGYSGAICDHFSIDSECQVWRIDEYELEFEK